MTFLFWSNGVLVTTYMLLLLVATFHILVSYLERVGNKEDDSFGYGHSENPTTSINASRAERSSLSK